MTDRADSNAGSATGSGESATLVGVRGVVLAGGRSRRFGSENKALATLDGTALLERVAIALEAATGAPPLVAVRDEAQRAQFEAVLEARDVTYVYDVPEFEGPVAGLAAAAGAATEEWLFACGCDMPLVSAEVVRWLGGERTEGDDAVCLATDDGPEPLHAFYRTDAVTAELPDFPETAGLRALLSALPNCRSVAAADAPPGLDAARSALNVNTKAALRSLRIDLADER
ncbi:molybdenum cofactor guanylyltransferase [Haloarcula nitratireducens]|uniref:Probable molybdenum cofactor guanylyltransferase n=1 Tax=Haloarcula nitratireducens TaxID=2487749 RepID=A0AAW4P5W1_9EURY|nr:molybdenum cofactor guanylyltransferase [Halomicroarcula nitratireducens]MBX0293346.1 molybdenum cofactor guanylyltransferase [Halomicroarcula nitratireducens]